MIILDGKKLSEDKSSELKKIISNMPVQPHLAIISIGDDKASEVYINKKEEFGKKIGAQVSILKLPEDIQQDRVLQEIDALNKDQNIHGIIIQLPIPISLDREQIINAISPNKDVDGLTATNLWKLMDGGGLPRAESRGIVPATARAITTLLKNNNIEIEGKHVVIVGDSLLVGKPNAMHFLNLDATVTVCHDKTENLASYTKEADILIVAVGKPSLISSKHVKEGGVLIDIGITRLDNGKVVGDIDFDSVKDIAGAITPVPGGVGPMTVLSLFENLIEVARV